MIIRAFESKDTLTLVQLFKETVFKVCAKDYSKEQLNAWVPNSIDEKFWQARFEKTHTFVCENDQKILGFANLEANGNIDMLYVAHDYQGQNVARMLYDSIEHRARQLSLKKLTSDVSITARPFFLKMGFKIEREYEKRRAGVNFSNAIMAKQLN